jgi:hypothetical protein
MFNLSPRPFKIFRGGDLPVSLLSCYNDNNSPGTLNQHRIICCIDTAFTRSMSIAKR